MTLSRRTLLAGATASIAAACSGQSGSSAAHLEQLLANHFGAAIAATEAAKQFVSDYAARLKAGAPCLNPWGACDTAEARLIHSFLESTTFLASGGDPKSLVYIAVFDPYTSPCASQLVVPL